jgi:RNA polymerase sigma factor (sigma-70 family)
MTLKSSARTPGALAGNHILERAEALCAENKIPAHVFDDARQEAALAILEDRDPIFAIRRFCHHEKMRGVSQIPAGKNPPVILSMADPATDAEAAEDSHETVLVRREETRRREAVAGVALLGLTKREQKIVRLRAMGWTQAEIAADLGISQQRVGQLQANITANARRSGTRT